MPSVQGGRTADADELAPAHERARNTLEGAETLFAQVSLRKYDASWG